MTGLRDPWERPLPLGLIPQPGESLSGYVLALAERLAVSPSELALRTGLYKNKHFVPCGLNTEIPPVALERFTAAARITEQEARALLLSQYAGTLYEAGAVADGGNVMWRSTESRAWAWASRTRACPLCLAVATDRGHGAVWKTSWRTGYAFACVAHGVLLVDTCGACGQNISVGSRRGTLVANPRWRSRAAACRERLDDGTMCGALLADTAAQQRAVPLLGPGGERVLRVQQHLDDLLASAEHGERPSALVSLGEAVSAPQYLRDLRLLTILYDVAGELLSLGPLPEAATDAVAARALQRRQPPVKGGDRILKTPWPSASLQAALVVTAVDHLALDPSQALSAATDLARAGSEHDLPLVSSIRFAGGPSFRLKQALRDDSRGSVTSAALRAALPTLDAVPALDPARVPSFLPEHDYHRLFGWLGDKPLSLARRGIPLSVLRLTQGCTLPEAAALLDLPVSRADSTALMLSRALRACDGFTRFRASVADLAAEWAADPARLDYRHRRQSLAGWELSPAQWEEQLALLRSLGSRIKQPQRLRLSATVHIWSRVTSSEPQMHPIILAQHSAALPRQEKVIGGLRPLLRTSVTVQSLDRLADRVAESLGL